MTPDELGRIRQIYEEALVLSGTNREAYLDRECHNKQIRSEVERLLNAHQHVPAWLDEPPLGSAKPLIVAGLQGRQLSGYTLIREIGRGGMGVVYLAERSDDLFHRKAAVKLVLPPGISDGVITRFQQEREILASLDHPNIARLIDAGLTEEGWPYFVMEFVDGQPIDRWCDGQKWSISRRIELFRSVIDAVQYAHQHLVVHRDLKPGNIFVTREGVVKLLDFGIAKVFSPAAAGRALETVTLAGMMTPEYASPEQVNGSPVTTQSDVYSLGVILYELLTGHRPYRLLSAAMHEVARVISEVDPARPSDVVTSTEAVATRDRAEITPEDVSAVREGDPNRLRRRLQGDLDSILLMALRKEPERRYRSVESFAEDLRRHLEHLPVQARQATPWERFSRFRRRNPGGFAAGVLISILFIAGLFAVGWQARHDVSAARLNADVVPFLAPFWLFSLGLALAGLCAAVYFAGASRAVRLGAGAGGAVWGLAILGKWRLEHHLGWWSSQIAGNPDPLMIFSWWMYLVVAFTCSAFLLVLVMIGRRFGWKGQALSLILFGLHGSTRERVWYGEFIPALAFHNGVVEILCGAAMLAVSGGLSLLVMRAVAAFAESTRGGR